MARNLLPIPQTVTVTVEYPTKKDSGGNSDHNPEQRASTAPSLEAYAAAGAGTVVLPPLVVGPYATQDFALDSVIAELPVPLPYCSVRIQYSGAPASLMAELASVEQEKDLVVDSKLQDEGWGWAGSGANPWHLDSHTESLIFLTDMGDKPVRIGFSVTANGIRYYLTRLKLNPHETRVIDLRKLRDAQQPDFKGNKIPAAATDGSVSWIRLDNVPLTGRVVVITRHGGVASNYDCCTCPCPANFTGQLEVSPSSVNLVPGGTAQLKATAVYESCTSQFYNYDETLQSSWQSQSPSVATVSAGNVTGQSGGTATITATLTDCAGWYYNPRNNPSCQCGAETSATTSSTATVQQPASLKVLSVTVLATGTTGNYGCTPSFNYGIDVDIKYQVLDQSAKAIQSSSMIPHETGTFTDGSHYSNNIGPTRISDTSEYTASDGTFHDAPVGACGNGVFSGAHVTQNIQILIGSSSYTVRSQTYTLGSSGAGHGTITNGSDVSASR